jgi:zinc/manganese transport system permease protein
VNVADFDFGILLPALVAGLLVTVTHVPLGIQVLNRGIVFIDLAIAQIAGCGVILANFLGMETQGMLVQISALSAALGGALLLTWTEKHWPEVQEAIIGTVFVLGASGAILLLSAEAHQHASAEHLKDLLVGQILWVSWRTVALVGGVYAVLLAVWFGVGQERLKRTGFYVVFACAVTASVQLVGLYLVFATLIVPALATRRVVRWRLAVSYALGAVGYAAGLVVSALTDWPSGPAIVWVMTALAIFVFALGPRQSVRAG